MTLDDKDYYLNSPFSKEVSDFLQYLALERNYSDKTVESYRLSLKRAVLEIHHFYPEINSWNDVTDTCIRKVIRTLDNLNDPSKRMSGRSKAHFLSVLKSFHKYLHEQGRISSDFVSNIESPKYGVRLPEYLTEDQFNELIKLPDSPEPRDYRDNAIMELLFSSGLRVAEVVSLLIDDADMSRGMLHVVGKGNKERFVPCGEYALRALKRWFRVRDTYSPQCSNIFVNRFGAPLTTRAVQIMIKKKGLDNALPIQLHPHKLRHSFATEMLRGGADIKVIQELMGHASSNTTGVYLHLGIGDLKKVYDQCHPLALLCNNGEDGE
ncbi:tyrosine-type recombinase/integrase [Succinimonas amylolytica]|uniref:tyrosine-type recombinase/integrase n=1 Tax=Succinimonas amylolytica TaxID=83769 RepID=UPI000364E341|nr:tyrosine-type recombinase/integrase [Succinimonas amylolytica]